MFSRRHLLKWVLGGVGAVVVGGAAGVELVNHGVLPGKLYLVEIDGACSVARPALVYGTLGPAMNGTFYSSARRRQVDYTIAYPPGHRPGDELALVAMLHGYGGNHTDAFANMTPAQAAALQVSVTSASSLAPIAVVTVDGGSGYWNWHPGDDPMSMVVDELIPMCQARGLGRSAHGVGLMGISMGGYGALAIAERYPDLIRAVAAISPAVWTSYDQARGANAGAFASAAAFATNDVITHASALSKSAVRVTSGADDPFHPGVVQFIKALPTGNMSVVIDPGCHTDPFFVSQEPASLAFLATNLS